MHGDTTPPTGATPGTPGAGEPPPSLETEWLDLATDSPEQGGLNPHVMRPTTARPQTAAPSQGSIPPTTGVSATRPEGTTAEGDLAAVDQLISIAGGDERAIRTPPTAYRRALRRDIAVGVGAGAVAFTALVLVLMSRPSDAGTPAGATGAGGAGVAAPSASAAADVVGATGAEEPGAVVAEPAADVAASAVAASAAGGEPAAGGDEGDAAAAGVADLAACRLADGAVTTAVIDVEDQTGLNDAYDVGWGLSFTNTTGDPVSIVVHRLRSDSWPGGAVDAWDTSWTEVAPGAELLGTDRFEWIRYPGGEILWSYPDRVAAFRAIRGCEWIAGDPATLDALASEVPHAAFPK